MRTPFRPFGAAALLLGVASLAACDDGSDGAAQAQQGPPSPTVTVANPLHHPIVEWDEFTGRFEAVEAVDIRARVDGYVQQITFEDGSMVEEGKLLFVIDPRPFRAALERAQAELQSAEARLELTRLERERVQGLKDSPALSQQRLDQRIQEEHEAEADAAAARAAVQEADLDLSFSSITAPVTGRVSDARVDIGNLVNDDTLLTTIVSVDPIEFVFDMSERDYLAYERAALRGELEVTGDAEIQVGIRLVDEAGWDREGRLNFVDNVVDNNTATVRARAIVENPDKLILPGQFGRLRLPGSPTYQAILIPDSAIGTDQSRKFVYVLDAEGVVEQREVRPGPTELGLRVIREGLSADDRLIVNGLAKIRPGMRVQVEEGSIKVAEDETS